MMGETDRMIVPLKRTARADRGCLAAALILGLGLARTRIGKVIRAAAHNPGMVSALGINTGLIYDSSGR